MANYVSKFVGDYQYARIGLSMELRKGDKQMLYPSATQTRTLTDLSGVWRFKLEEGLEAINPEQPLQTDEVMAVPGSFNDQSVDAKVRYHAGYVWYETDFHIAHMLLSERIVLRFGAATHEATVYVNGQEAMHHKGGFLPFEGDISPYVMAGKNRLTVRLSNILDYTSLPVGNYTESVEADGRVHRKIDENFDFFNYAGLHRPVKIYTTPQSYIEDIVITYDVEKGNAQVRCQVAIQGEGTVVRVTVFDEDGQPVGQGEGADSTIILEGYRAWEPLDAYLYTAKVELLDESGVPVDVYEEPFGIRTVEVKNGQFLINGKPFYFKGFGKHEDTYINGRGLNEAANVLDLNMFKWMGANSFRTSHYPYSEEMMRLADRYGIVVTDEVPAVGLFDEFNAVLSGGEKRNTWELMKTEEAHRQALREMIARDKNHACVVMWSVANEPASHQQGARAYFEPLVELTRELDPQKRPVTIVNILMATPDKDEVLDLVDVISLNRYYGWYVNMADLESAEAHLRKELAAWHGKLPEHPIMFTEYGADTVAGFHSMHGIPYTEEYQVEYYRMNHRVADELPYFIGEQVWNFADFETKIGLIRVNGNKKGIFTRAREPKMVAQELRKRWISIPDFNYKS